MSALASPLGCSGRGLSNNLAMIVNHCKHVHDANRGVKVAVCDRGQPAACFAAE